MEKFHDARTALTDRILNHLRDHPGQAFCVMDLVAEFEGLGNAANAGLLMLIEKQRSGSSDTWNSYSSAVHTLLQQQQVVSATVAGVEYFALPEQR